MWKQSLLSAIGATAFVFLTSSASATTVFGARLNHEPTPPEICKATRPGDMCSWVLTIAQQNAGHERAPKNGIIAKVRLRSCTPGSFVLQRARANPATKQAQVVSTGPAINYKGNPINCNGGVFIETFTVNMPVTLGDYLSVVATKVGFIYNASGEGSLVFDPLLPDGGPLRATTTTGLGNGFLLLQALYND